MERRGDHRRLPIYRMDRFSPAKRMDDPAFGEPTGGALKGGVYWPTAGYVTDPALSAQNIAAAAERAGATFRFHAEVTEILTEGGPRRGRAPEGWGRDPCPRRRQRGRSSQRADQRDGGRHRRHDDRNAPLRQEVVHVPAPEGFDFYNDGMIVSDSDIACYCRPERGNNILIGSEDPPCDDHQWVDDRDWSTDFTDQWTTQAMRYAQRVPSLGIPSRTKGVVELYDAATDWIPIYDKSSLPGFYMACGTSGNQYKNAPVAGRLMAALIAYCEGGNDHDTEPMTLPLRPYRPRDKRWLLLPKTGDQHRVELFGSGMTTRRRFTLAILERRPVTFPSHNNDNDTPGAAICPCPEPETDRTHRS
jgi:sarcosine oxidase subunit beta